MSKLDHPRARELLAQTRLTAGQVRDCRRDLTAFMERYLPRFYRQEQRNHATLIIRGLLSGLERKTAEPIARTNRVARKPVPRRGQPRSAHPHHVRPHPHRSADAPPPGQW